MSEHDKKNKEALISSHLPEIGVLKEQEKKRLEKEIEQTLGELNMFTKKELLELMSMKKLEDIQGELESNNTLKGKTIEKHKIETLLRLFREIGEITKLGIEELRLELHPLNPTHEWQIDETTFPSHQWKGIQKLEKSPLGKNIVLDLSGIFVGGIIDSGTAIFKLILRCFLDIFRLPADIIQLTRERPQSSSKSSTK